MQFASMERLQHRTLCWLHASSGATGMTLVYYVSMSLRTFLARPILDSLCLQYLQHIQSRWKTPDKFSPSSIFCGALHQ